MKLLKILVVLFLLSSLSYGQNNQWINFLPGAHVRCLSIEGQCLWFGTENYFSKINMQTGEQGESYSDFLSGGNYIFGSIAIDQQGNKWVGTIRGLAKFDGKNWTVYNPVNSGLPNFTVYSVVVDPQGNKWIGTDGGLVKFDGEKWAVYDTSNPGLPAPYIHSIAIDQQGNKWVGIVKGNKWMTIDGRLAKFDGQNWTVYDKNNSGMPDAYIKTIIIDKQGNKWIGTIEGLVKFDGENWNVWNTSNSGLPNSNISSIAIDQLGNKWIATWGGGLVKFDGEKWAIYDTSNSGLPNNFVLSIAIDQLGNKWIGSFNGLSAFNEEGVTFSVTDVKKDNLVPVSFSMAQNYPNPFNPSTTINYSIPEGRVVTLKVYDMLGKEVITLLNEYNSAGNHSVQFNASQLPSGIYIYTIQAGEFRDSKKLVLLK